MPAESCPTSFSAPRMQVLHLSRIVDSEEVQLLVASEERDPRSAAPSQTLGHCFPIGTHNIRNSYIFHDKNNSQKDARTICLSILETEDTYKIWCRSTITNGNCYIRHLSGVFCNTPPSFGCLPCGSSANSAWPVYWGCQGQLTRSPHKSSLSHIQGRFTLVTFSHFLQSQFDMK
jgi:hypothetical protein